jgi:hypothetical protein
VQARDERIMDVEGELADAKVRGGREGRNTYINGLGWWNYQMFR